MEEPVSIQEAARQFGVKADRLRRAAWEGRLEARQLGNMWMVLPSEVTRFLSKGDKRRTRVISSVAYQQTPSDHQSAALGTGTEEETKGGSKTQMARVIAVAVPKGGTGKTTTTVNLGAALAEQGKKVLLVDFDPQGNLTQSLGFRPADLEHTVYSALKYFLTRFESQVELAIQKTEAGLDLLPASARLNLANDELAVAIQREFVLQKLLAPVASRYDYILIDTLPYLGVLVVNALVVAKEVLIPLQAEYLATESVSLILEQIQLMRRSGLNPELSITGILLTMVDNRTVINREAVEYARRTFGKEVKVFDTMVRRSVRFAESQANHLSILQYEPNGESARAYRALAKEVMSSRATSKA